MSSLPKLFTKGSKDSLSAFTLVEIMVSVGVIGLLATLIFPTYSTSMSKARDTQCIQNLKQWGTAVAQYATDNDQQVYLFPNSNPPHWADAAASPYLAYFPNGQTLFKMRVCPGDTARKVDVFTMEYNFSRAPVSGATTLALPTVTTKSKYLLMSDAAIKSNAGAFNGSEIDAVIKPICVKPSTQVIRHNGKANVLWADFHISSETYADFVNNKTTWFTP